MNHVAERHLAFRCGSDRSSESGDDDVFGRVELVTQFDSVMREHLRRIHLPHFNYKPHRTILRGANITLREVMSQSQK